MERLRWLFVFLSGLAAVTSVVGTVFFDNIVAKKALAAAVVLSIIVAVLLPKLGRIYLKRFSAFSVGAVDSKAGVRDVCRLGRSTYNSVKKSYPDEKLPLDWWTKFPFGIYKITDRADKMWMYMSIWPVTEEAFDKLKMGMSEENLTPDDVLPVGDKPFYFFYIADICRTNRASRSVPGVTEYIRSHLIAGYFDSMLATGFLPKGKPVEFIAHPVSTPGRINLKAFGFVKVTETTDKDVYYKCITPKFIGSTIRSCLDSMEKNYRLALSCST